MNEQTYAGIQKILHWLIALAVLGMLVSGFYMTHLVEEIGFGAEPADQAQLRDQLFMLHKSTGILILALMIVRLFFWHALGAPRPPEHVPFLMRMASAAAKSGLFLAVTATALIGWAAISIGGFLEPIYGLIDMPALLEKGRGLARYSELMSAHALLAYAIIGILAAHVGGALFHLLVRRDGVFKRMWF